MCIAHIRAGSYAHELHGGMSAQLFEILLHGRFLFPLGLFDCFYSKMLFIYLRERGEKKHEREG